ncbi:hypothetical protein GCM10027277_34520 [Pseudoduganella ginsengisoli]|uniref:Transporter substrate-binding domain-containing protein n=1 Tax=Pseudoduganella ginsengisoli TaxID=1462440 RepID=A0A6L6Q6V5_9BURK|nr:hypothetical protein [Pseudoduganella ginsengisoli]MTW05583.1 hypothetical protein [Pseudoduganella ginsengisoli]
MRRYLFLLLSLLCALLPTQAQPPLKSPLVLQAPNDPPHNMLADTRIIGQSTEQVEEMFRRAALPYTIRITPWPRAY